MSSSSSKSSVSEKLLKVISTLAANLKTLENKVGVLESKVVKLEQENKELKSMKSDEFKDLPDEADLDALISSTGLFNHSNGKSHQNGPSERFHSYYRSKPCQHGARCKKMETCYQYHNDSEIGKEIKIDRKNTRPCIYVKGGGKCNRTDCWRAHTIDELKINLCPAGKTCVNGSCKRIHQNNKHEYWDNFCSGKINGNGSNNVLNGNGSNNINDTSSHHSGDGDGMDQVYQDLLAHTNSFLSPPAIVSETKSDPLSPLNPEPRVQPKKAHTGSEVSDNDEPSPKEKKSSAKKTISAKKATKEPDSDSDKASNKKKTVVKKGSDSESETGKVLRKVPPKEKEESSSSEEEEEDDQPKVIIKKEELKKDVKKGKGK